jgi:hypothetical protein
LHALSRRWRVILEVNRMRKLTCIAFSVCLVLGSFPGPRAWCVGLVKVCAVGYLPEAAVGWAMGWERERVRFHRASYRDGFARACRGRGFK